MKNKELYLDNALRKDALEKIERTKTLRIKRFAHIKSEDATLDEIRVYLKKVDQYENIDMDNERDLAQKKLSVMHIGQKFLDGVNINEYPTLAAGKTPGAKPQ
jgi:hypothetical protein